MATLTKDEFITDLRTWIERHCQQVTAVFQPLNLEQLRWKPAPKEWNILQCFEHLNLTHVYYMPKIERALQSPNRAPETINQYKASFWGGVYMAFSFNPRFSFPAPNSIRPTAEAATAVDPQELALYLTKQEALQKTLSQLNDVNLSQTPIRIENKVNFNLGDCLKILVYHDELHFNQARRIVAAMPKL